MTLVLQQFSASEIVLAQASVSLLENKRNRQSGLVS
jgi:hypothetical protein